MNRLPYVAGLIGTTLPNLIDPAQPLCVVFSTYRSVRGHTSGPVDLPGRPNLRICILDDAGDRSINWMYAKFVLGVAMDGEMGMRLAEEARADIRLSAEEITGRNGLALLPIVEAMRSAAVLVVAYAGLNNFDGTVELVRRVCAEHPNVRGVVVTCDCQARSKENALIPMVECGQLAAAALSKECGARKEMRQILDAIIGLWPEQAAGIG